MNFFPAYLRKNDSCLTGFRMKLSIKFAVGMISDSLYEE